MLMVSSVACEVIAAQEPDASFMRAGGQGRALAPITLKMCRGRHPICAGTNFHPYAKLLTGLEIPFAIH
jgi:hypothetical protein